tara:strand:+ start:221 stop:1126 length:906 start_codon:yes stop_codon:yes gene_type:complete
MAKVLRDDLRTQSPQKDQQLEERSPETNRRYNSGLRNRHKTEPVPILNITEAEKLTSGNNNAHIILGRDRPAGPNSGYGKGNDSHAGCIDIIVGASGKLARAVEVYPDGRKTDRPVKTNKNTILDSSRIYISQKADIDDYFNLKTPENPPLKARAAIAIKSDLVRVIGREGIRLVTDTDVYNAPGVNVGEDRSGIWLIAGNAPDLAEPMVLGNKLSNTFLANIELLSNLNGTFQTFLNGYLRLLKGLAPTPAAPAAAAAIPSVAEIIEKLRDNEDLYFRFIEHYCSRSGKGTFLSPFNYNN